MKTSAFDYPVKLVRDGRGFLVRFPDVPEAITHGESPEAALEQAVDALETALSFYVERRAPLPLPGKPRRGQHVVRPSALERAKLAIYQTMLTQGVRRGELARRLGWHGPQVDRLFNLRHQSRLDQLEAAARALGKTLEVRLG
jgi:antitoxin HicB